MAGKRPNLEMIGKAVVSNPRKRKGIYEGDGYRFYNQSASKMQPMR